ncbi:MAG TPA: class I SAM-dependent methyltransferase [Candidatus Eisenbacteria bacterium]|nr:class I SAM-dependent methyltransferase [Candidatus Eisenbacteria bacterium]
MTLEAGSETAADALARLYDLDLADDPGDLGLYEALAARTGGPIVELGVGSGRIAVPLAALGHDVVGIDRDSAMLTRARARAEREGPATASRLALVEADMLGPLDTDPPRRGAFRLAILALNSILLLAGRDEQRRVIRVMAELLGPGGIAVVDAWQPDVRELVQFDGRLTLEWLRRDPDGGRDVAKLMAAWYDGTARVVTLTTLFDEAAPGQPPRRWTRSDALRMASADDLRSYAEDAGLEIEQLAGDYDLTPLGPASERVVLVARRPGQAGPS